MNLDVTVNGRPWRVAIAPGETRGRFDVSVKGRRRTFDVAWVDADTISLISIDGKQGRVREAGIQLRREASGATAELDVVLDGKTFRATAAPEGALRRVEHPSGAVEGRQTVVAPMPGRIVRVLVAPGDAVAARQGLVVVEAMKMENELRSPKAGVVREVHAREGAAIEAGAVLVVVE